MSRLVHGSQVSLVQTSVPFANDVLLTVQGAAWKRKQKVGIRPASERCLFRVSVKVPDGVVPVEVKHTYTHIAYSGLG